MVGLSTAGVAGNRSVLLKLPGQQLFDFRSGCLGQPASWGGGTVVWCVIPGSWPVGAVCVEVSAVDMVLQTSVLWCCRRSWLCLLCW
jgi:hypothetical protein